MANNAFRRSLPLGLLLTLPSASACAADSSVPDFFAAAVCEPPYSIEGATDLYEAAQKLGKADTSLFGAEIYHLPMPISRDGFTAQDIVFAGSAVGVLVDGAVADKLAAQYRLTLEANNLFGTSSKGYARLLPEAQQAMKRAGLISIVAREGPAMKGKTLLACEFVSDEDRKALEASGTHDRATAFRTP